MWPSPQFSADLVTFTEEILNGKLHFLCSFLYVLLGHSGLQTIGILLFVTSLDQVDKYFVGRLALSKRRPLSYRNQSIDLRSKSMDWFLYNGLRLERVKYYYVLCNVNTCKSF